MRALIAAADIRTGANIETILATENFICDVTDLAEDGLHMASAYHYDILVLDIGPADIDGYRMMQQLRAARVSTPMLILSPSDQLEQKVRFLHCGADDFLTRPFDERELTARILAIVRRSNGHSQSTIRTGKLEVNLAARVVSVNGRPVRLTAMEYRILELLSLRKGTVLPKEAFLDYLYGGLDEPESKTVDVLICKLRKKLARATGGSHYIETLWGQGYVLRDPVPANPI